ncbi:early protein E2 [Saimiri sciureus papillomavirus 1]|uniref:Regulatory protein E2 n=1 Tax=Saimiri sciureus papillomavirus 1 TaxID=990304 RepID=W5QK75_9PAPI|nr:early protein E2 [Saimiri sciureus papillomavirus 1]AEA35058.1 early protein E2 [Saimiri sciureus papillomavirus 1]
MEGLTSRLDALQEQLIDCYEADSKNLEDHIHHWSLLRKENAYMYRARQLGMHKVGLQIVPPLAVSQQKAHQAIEMHLALQSLNKSQYRTEDWTLTDTSQEMWMCPPQKCFKKRGKRVEVWFDGRSENAMQYTLWTHIYVQREDGTWTKVAGYAEHKGLYYLQGKERCYYVDFQQECERYGTTGTWVVQGADGQNETCDSVSSTSTDATTAAAAALSFTGFTGQLQTTCKAAVPQPITSTPTKRPADTELDCAPKRGRLGDTSPKHRGPATHVAGHRAKYNSGCNNSSRVNSDNNGTDSDHQVAPVVLLKGDANCLKCHRFRLRKYSELYVAASTTWYWAAKTGSERLGQATVTVSFASEGQRARFLAKVPIPSGITVIQGTMPI